MSTAVSTEHEPEKKRRAWTWLLAPLVVPLALLAGFGVGAGIFLATEHGKQFVTHQALRLVNGSLPGSVTVDDVAVSWLTSLEMAGVSARSPSGDPVFRADRIVIRYSPLSLLSGVAKVKRIRIEHPVVTISYAEDGLSNLDRLLGPPADEPEPESEPWDGRLPVDVDVERIEIVGGAFRLTDATSSPPVLADLDRINLDASYRATGPVHTLVTSPLELSLLEPDLGRMAVETAVTYDLGKGEDHVRVDHLHVTGDGLEVRGVADFKGFDLPVGDVYVAVDHFDSAFLKRFDSSLPVRGVLTMGLFLHIDTSQQARLAVALRLPAGRIDLGGRLDLSGLTNDVESLAYDLELAASSLRADSFLAMDIPPLNPLDFRATLRGKGVTPNLMDTRFTVRVAPMAYQGYTFDGGSLFGLVQKGTIVLEASRIESPYATLDAQGLIDLGGPVRATVRLAIPDLSRLGHQIDLPLRGDLEVDARVSGEFAAPRIDMSLASALLEYGPEEEVLARMLGLTGAATIQVLEAEGSSGVRATVALAGDEAGFPTPLLRAFSVTAQYEGLVDVDFEATTVHGLPLQVAARYDPGGGTNVAIGALSLPLGDAPWTLESPMTVRLEGDDVDVTPFTLSGPDGHISARVQYRPGGDSDLYLSANGVLLDNFAPFLRDVLPALGGRLGCDIRVTGPASAPAIALSSSLEDLSAAGLPLLDAHLRASNLDAAGGRFTGELETDFSHGGGVQATFDMPLTVTLEGDAAFDPAATMAARWRITALDLAQFSQLAKDYVEDLTGKLEGHATLSGSLERPDLDATLAAREVDGVGQHPFDLRLNVRYDGELLRADGMAMSPVLGPVPLLVARLDVPVHITPEFAVEPGWDEVVTGKIAIPAQKVAQFGALAAELERVRGDVRLDLDIGGRLGDPSLRLDFRARDIRPPGYPAIHFDTQAQYGAGHAALVVRGQIANTAPANMQAAVDIPLADIIQGAEVTLSNLDVRLDVPELDFSSLPPILRGPQVTGGAMRLSARLRCPENTPEFSASADISRLSVGGAVHDIHIETSYAGDMLGLEADVVGPAGDEARIEGDVPLVLRLPLSASETVVDYPRGMDVTAGFPGLDLALVNAFMPTGMTLEGTLAGRFHLSGTLLAPEARGSVTVSDALFYYPAYGLLYENMEGRVRLTPSLLALEDVTMRAGKGELLLDGAIALVDSSPGDMDIDVLASRADLMNGPYGRMTVDGEVHIGGTVDFPEVSGEVTIPAAVIKLPDIASTLVMELSGLEKPKELAPAELPPNIRVLTSGGTVTWHAYETGEAEEEVPFDMDADVTIHMPRGFWVQNTSQEVVMELAGDIRYSMEDGLERMEGEVSTVRGELNLFSQPLTIREGTITFTGGSEIDPVLNIVSDAETTDYGTVSLKISGRSSAPVVTFDSENGYDPADILAILVIGKPLSESTDPADSIKVASQVESLAAGVLAGIARKQLADKIPIDYLEIRADSFSSADLRVGKYVTPKLFVSYKRKLTMDNTMEENVNEVRAEYQLSRSLYFESFYGDAGIWGGDINWRKSY